MIVNKLNPLIDFAYSVVHGLVSLQALGLWAKQLIEMMKMSLISKNAMSSVKFRRTGPDRRNMEFQKQSKNKYVRSNILHVYDIESRQCSLVYLSSAFLTNSN